MDDDEKTPEYTVRTPLVPLSATEAAARRAAEQAATERKKGRAADDPSWDLHEAAYFGRLDVAQRLLDSGVDPNTPHQDGRGWICGKTALSKVICAWHVSAAHVEIAKLLLSRGARVDASHLTDWGADATGSPEDLEILALLEQHRS
jgi:hypothetical protein